MTEPMHISCRQAAVLSPRSWKVIVSGDGPDRTIDLHDPFSLDAEENLVRWYLEDFAVEPFAKYRARSAAAELCRYGSLLWKQLGIDSAGLSAALDTSATIILDIVLSQEHHDIDRIHWEVLENLGEPPCRIIVHRELRNNTSVQAPQIPRTVQVFSGILRILVVSARSNTRRDVPPRLTSLPLVQTLRGNRRIELAFVHTGTFEEFEKALDERPVSEKVHLVHFDLHGKIDKKKGPILEFTDSKLKHRTSRTASSVAEVLHRNGVKWTVLCACRTAQSISTFSHLALHFLTHGITGVFAMRYELKASAAKILTSSFYTALCQDGKTFIEAAHASRCAMQEDPSRHAKFGELVEIQDSLVPAVYTVDGADLRLSKDASKNDYSEAMLTTPMPLPEIIGREDDIRKLSMLLRGDTSFLVLFGDIGTGKSLLMKHLAWWWKETRLFRRIVYVNVSLADAKPDGDNAVGLMALAKGIWRSVVDDNKAPLKYPEPMKYLIQAMAAAKGQDTILLLDGVDELYHASVRSGDTAEGWSDFFRVAKLLSVSSSKLVVATCTPSLCGGSETSDSVFSISRSMSTGDAQRLVVSFQPQAQQEDAVEESPDTHLLRVFDVLQHNPMVLKSLSNVLRERFHGLEAILCWDIEFDKDVADVSYSKYTADKLGALQALDFNEDQGLDRVHRLMLTILNHLAQRNQYQDMWALLTVGLWTDVLPHPDAMTDVFKPEVTWFLQMIVPVLQKIVGGISKHQLDASYVPFELWSIMNETPSSESGHPPFSTGAMIHSLKRTVQLITAAKLLTATTEPLVDGKRGYQIHPALTLWLRRILRTLSCMGLLISFVECTENRAKQMASLSPDVTESKPAIQAPSFPFIEREKWNLMGAIAVLHQKCRLLRNPAFRAQLQTSTPFAWASFHVLAPICATTEDFCTWFLTRIVLEYIDVAAPLVSSSLADPLPDPLGPLLYLLNWAIDMTQRYRLEEEQATPLRLRRLLMVRVEAMRAAGTGEDELREDNFVVAEMKTLLNELRIALRSPEFNQANIDRMVEHIKTRQQASPTIWRGTGSFFTDDMRGLLNPNTISEDLLRQLQTASARRSEAVSGTHFAENLAMQSSVIDSISDIYMKPTNEENGFQSIDSLVSMSWFFDLLRFMEEDLDFFKSLPPWYADLVPPIFAHLRRGNIPQAMAAARRGLQAAERDGHVLVASQFRLVCRRLGELDSAYDYDAHQALLTRMAEFTTPFLKELLLTHLAKHDTPAAYRHAVTARDEMRIGVALAPLLGLVQEQLPQIFASLTENLPQIRVSIEGLERLVDLLEPYKEARLEDKREWVGLLLGIRELLQELAEESKSMDFEWVVQAREVLADPLEVVGILGKMQS